MPRKIDRQMKAAYFAFPLYIVLFLLVVATGYFTTIRNYVPDLPLPVTIGLAALVAFGIYCLVRHAAYTLDDTYRDPGASMTKWVAVLLLVFLCSGLSLATVAVTVFQGPALMQGDIEAMAEAYSTLEERGIAALADSPYAALKAQVETKRAALMSEIDKVMTGPHCGIGDYAKSILREIGTLLPSVRVLEGTDRVHDCGDRKGIAIGHLEIPL